MHTYRAHSGVTVLADYLEVPGLGFLAVNASVAAATGVPEYRSDDPGRQ